MKPATPALIALLNAAGGVNPLVEADFYTFTLADGTQLRFGAAPFTITAEDDTIWNPPAIDGSGGLWVPGISWPPSLMGENHEYGTVGHWRPGLDSDRWGLIYSPRLRNPITGALFPDKINGVPWIQAARVGMLENADVIVSTAYYAAMPAAPFAPGGESPVGTLVTARGMVGQVDTSDSAVYIGITDYRALLDQMMPRNIYQSGCRHRLYDDRCTLDSALFTDTGVIDAASAGVSLISAAPISAPSGSMTYTLGLLTMTSGLNTGFRRLVINWDGAAAFQLLDPFPLPLVAGDTFSVAAGCDKALATCQLFANEENFGGEPFIPIPETSYG